MPTSTPPADLELAAISFAAYFGVINGNPGAGAEANAAAAAAVALELENRMIENSTTNTQDKCDSLSIMHFIGKDSDINNNKYINKCDSIYLPINNLPCVYFPFYYDNTENSVNNIKNLVPILQSYSLPLPQSSSTCKISGDTVNHKNVLIDIDDLLSKISNIVEDYQPYNKKNIFHMTLSIFIFWIIIFLFILKIIYNKYNGMYTYIIIGLTICLLLFASIWALVITSQNI